jgi:8-oxo-dGTP pyrophosphatase MutT (NUDIX family)
MEDFIDRLSRRLTMDLPGEDAQYRMAPVGRPRTCDAWPMDGPVRQSAVLLYLFTEHDDWHMVLMKRPEYDGAHGGQVSIPGGQLEPGEDHSEAALREFAEETGVHVDSRQLLGRLSELFIPTSNFLVRPFVAYAGERPRFRPNPEEVEEIIELTIPALISDLTVRRGKVRLATGVRVETPYFDVNGHMVWGATAMILSELREVLRDLR